MRYSKIFISSFFTLIFIFQSVFAISNVQHSVDGNKVTLTYQGTPPFYVNIRPDTNIGQEGGYLWATTYSNNFSYDMNFAINPSKKFYYGVKDTGWSTTNSFDLIIRSCDECSKENEKKCITDKTYQVCGYFYDSCLKWWQYNYSCPLGRQCQDGECIVKLNNATCEKLSANSEGNNKVNILFIPENVSQKDLDAFKNKLINHVEAFYQTEPFKSNKIVLNFYFLRTTQPFFEDGQIAFGELKDSLKVLSSTCKYNISQVIIVTKEHILTPASIGEGMASAAIDDPWTTLHEFGHSFTGLSDTYYPTINHQGTGFFGYDAPNTDEGGCKKWCSSNAGVYETECTRIVDENECKQHERTPNEWGWGCNSPEKCCVWLDHKDPFFKSQCVNPRDHKNIGIGCLENIGCYYGTSVQGKWRPGDDFDNNSFLGIMGGDVSQPWKYDPVSIRTINLKIQCCYPQQSTNYPIECKNYSQRYTGFVGCNSSTIK